MSPERKILDHLHDIRENTREARRFTEGMSYKEFENDTKTVYAVIQALQIIGEAAKSIPDSVRDRSPAGERSSPLSSPKSPPSSKMNLTERTLMDEPETTEVPKG